MGEKCYHSFMAKLTSKYICQQCGYSQIGWAGKCPDCNAWGSLVETVSENSNLPKNRNKNKRSNTRPLTLLKDISSGKISRIKTDMTELDLVLGGGLVPGHVVLLAGEPGIGKSTILLQVAQKLGRVLYVSGEESGTQVKIRADRLRINSSKINFLENTDVDEVIASAQSISDNLDLLIVDSIQTMNTGDLSGMSGSVGQVRECASRLLSFAKSKNIPLIIVGHVTKEGTVAGPAVLAHIVDTVLWFEGDKSLTLRMLRSVKNRFGPTDEVGIFTMEDKGLVSVSANFNLIDDQNTKNVSGSAITSLLEGTRPILAEVQSLVITTKLAFPRRVAQGIDSKKLELILAVLTKHCGLNLFSTDVFVNLAGGISARDPGLDLAVALSVASSYFEKPIPAGTLILGEVGLLGEIRSVVRLEGRIKDAKRQGITHFITPKEYSSLAQVVRKLFK